jgi:hypothetical protein
MRQKQSTFDRAAFTMLSWSERKSRWPNFRRRAEWMIEFQGNVGFPQRDTGTPGPAGLIAFFTVTVPLATLGRS